MKNPFITIYIIVITFICWFISLPLINKINIPINNTYGLISRIIINGENPKTNYIIYLLLIIPPSLLFILLIKICEKNSILKQYLVKVHLSIEKFFTNFSIEKFVSILLMICWIVNITNGFLSSTNFAHDGFHYGEKIGLFFAFLKDRKSFFEHEYVMIHGLGLNVLPGLLGHLIGGSERDLAYSWLILSGETLLSTIVSFLILAEVTAYININNRWKIFLAFIFIYFILTSVLFIIQDRDTIFLFQTFLVIRWLRLLEQKGEKYCSNYIYSALIGISVPLSFLYVYDRAVFFFLPCIYLVFHFYITRGINFLLSNGLIAFISGATSWILISLVLGFKALLLSISQILYWAKFGSLIWSLRYPEVHIIGGNVKNWILFLLQLITLNLFLLNLRHSFSTNQNPLKAFLHKYSIIIIMFLCSISYMRSALGRSDEGHIIAAGFFVVFSFLAVLFIELFEDLNILISKTAIVIIFLIASNLININSLNAATNVASAFQFSSLINSSISRKNSDLITLDYLNTYDQIKDEIKDQSCFYTLTSEGIWYYLLSAQPCSKYYYLVYSRSPQSQQDIVKDLENNKPKIILYSSPIFSNNIDLVKKEVSHLIVHQYIWQQYRPYKLINNNWFWIRRDSRVDSINNIIVPLPNKELGNFDELKPVESNNKLDVSALGWSLIPADQIPNQNSILLTANPVSKPDKLTAIALTSVTINRPDVNKSLNIKENISTGWSVDFNKLTIPAETMQVRAWRYNSSDDKFYELPSHTLKTLQGLLKADIKS